jgi:DNA-binding transcriptional MerR regulator
MGYPAEVIPEKIFFKIGEVCELLDVQPHVLRYWETEFPMLAPQKNRSGQRTYRRRDVEITLRIKELLYDELYTIAGAKKRLSIELRDSNRLKIVPNETPKPESHLRVAPTSYISDVYHDEEPEDDFVEEDVFDDSTTNDLVTSEKKTALRQITQQLLEVLEMLEEGKEKPRDNRRY